jgi:hypothetical protein
LKLATNFAGCVSSINISVWLRLLLAGAINPKYGSGSRSYTNIYAALGFFSSYSLVDTFFDLTWIDATMTFFFKISLIKKKGSGEGAVTRIFGSGRKFNYGSFDCRLRPCNMVYIYLVDSSEKSLSY